MTSRFKRPTPTQVRAARRRRQARRKKLLAIGGLTGASTVAFLLILGLILPGLPFGTFFAGGEGDIFETGAVQAVDAQNQDTDVQEIDVQAIDVQPSAPDVEPADEAAAPPLPPNPILGGVDIFYNCPDGCEDLVAQLTSIAEEFDAADSPIGITPKTDMDARILLIGANSNRTLDAFDETAVRDFLEANINQ